MSLRYLRGACLVALVSVASLEAAGSSVRLIDAVKQGNRTAVRALITERANVNAAEPDGMTALHWAVRADDAQTAQRSSAPGTSNAAPCGRARCSPSCSSACSCAPSCMPVSSSARAKAASGRSARITMRLDATRLRIYHGSRALHQPFGRPA